jgi:hypothetical protein
MSEGNEEGSWVYLDPSVVDIHQSNEIAISGGELAMDLSCNLRHKEVNGEQERRVPHLLLFLFVWLNINIIC